MRLHTYGDSCIFAQIGRRVSLLLSDLSILDISQAITYSLDLDMPTNCDDEYWTHPDPAQAFKQPATRPSTLAYFNLLLKLVQIHALALRTIVSKPLLCVHPLLNILFSTRAGSLKPLLGSSVRNGNRKRSRSLSLLCRDGPIPSPIIVGLPTLLVVS